jgi:Uma2 family endonuclease
MEVAEWVTRHFQSGGKLMSAKLPSSMLPERLHPPAAPGVQAEAILFKTEDDTPVDNIYSEKQQRLLAEPLYSCWGGSEGGRKFVAMANVGLFYSRVKPPIVPDGLLSMDVDAPDEMWQREHRSYFISQYGKSPEVVIEVVSNKEGEELGEKLGIYAEAKVLYYVVWDPEDHLRKGRLLAFRLQGDHYEPLHRLWFDEVGLGLKAWQGAFEGKKEEWLRWCNREEEVIPTGAEAKDIEKAYAQGERQRADLEKNRADEAKQRADAARQRADQEKHRADQEKQRAERLAAQLRSLGIEPQE